MLLRLMLILPLLGVGCAPTVDATAADAGITAAVVTALLNDSSVDGTLVNVRTEAGVVYLEGQQPTTEAVADVVDIASGVEGVRDVQSSLTVGSAWPDPADISN